jgi:hypothetical protein
VALGLGAGDETGVLEIGIEVGCGVGDRVGSGESVAVGVGSGVGEGVGEGEGDGVGEGVAVGLGLGVGVGLGEGLGDGLGVGEGVTVGATSLIRYGYPVFMEPKIMPLRGCTVKKFQRLSVDKTLEEFNTLQFKPSALVTILEVPFCASAVLPKTSELLKNMPDTNGIQPSLGGV